MESRTRIKGERYESGILLQSKRNRSFSPSSDDTSRSVDSVEAAAAALAGNLLPHMDCCLDRFINSLCYIDTFLVTTSQETMVHFLPWLLWYCLFERIKLLDIIGNIFVQSNFLPAKIFINTLRDYFTKNLIENKKIDGLGIKHRLLTICI